MMKKTFAVLCTVWMLLCLAFAACAASAPIIDQADLFSAEEEVRLTGMIESFREKTGMDFAIITTQNAHNSTQQEIADELYDRGGYGLGDEMSGILYYIDMYERIPHLTTTGAMIDYMTDERIDAAHERCYSQLASGNYAQAAEQMIATVYDYVRSGIPEGQYQYDIITGQQLTARHKALTSGEIGLCAIIGLVVALIYKSSVKGSYTLRGSTYDYSFRENSETAITDSTDDYIRSTTTRTRKASPPPSSGGRGPGGRPSGGSGVHTSSSGRIHGGGSGRKF